MPRLLLVEDDRFLSRSVEKLLSTEGYFCKTASSALEARQELAQGTFDLVILDVGLPDTDGFAFCRQIRSQYKMPILFLSARQDSADKVIGLEVGGDDYMTKPFTPRELVARVRAQLRRSMEYSQSQESLSRIVIGAITVDMDRRDALRDGVPVQLTEREFELMHLLARNKDRALAADWIFENVWGYESETGAKTLAVFIRRLRCKIEKDPDRPAYLLTARGYGYKLTEGLAP